MHRSMEQASGSAGPQLGGAAPAAVARAALPEGSSMHVEESLRKKPRMLNGLAVFDLDATTDWEAFAAPVAQVQAPEVTTINELAAESVDDLTDVPGILWSHVRPMTVVYGERSGIALDSNKVAEGRLRELRQMNNHHVYDYIPESENPPEAEDRDGTVA